MHLPDALVRGRPLKPLPLTPAPNHLPLTPRNPNPNPALPRYEAVPVLARVCKRWRAVANDPSWKPAVVAYAWGSARVTGVGRAAARPALLPLSLGVQLRSNASPSPTTHPNPIPTTHPHPNPATHPNPNPNPKPKPVLNPNQGVQLRSLCCAHEATFALTVDGDVYHWGVAWLRTPGQVASPLPGNFDCPRPQRVPELSDISQVACTPPGYYHARSGGQGYACAAVTRRGGLYTWGISGYGQLLHDETTVARPR